MKHLRVESWSSRSGILASLRSASILTLLGALFLLLILPTTGWSEEPPVATATWEVRELKGDDESKYTVTIYQVEAPGGTRWIWRAIDPENGSALGPGGGGVRHVTG